MGYVTQYSLGWEAVSGAGVQDVPRCEHKVDPKANYCSVCGTPNKSIDLDERVAAYIESHEEISYALQPDGETSESCKWHDHEKDMRAMSAEIKHVLFTLHGEGEENDDIWNAYFLDGKMQKEKAQIQITPFDKKKLG